MIIAVWGNDKTCKTTLALTFPTPLKHLEFDLGGFDRAKKRFAPQIADGLIQSEKFVVPIQISIPGKVQPVRGMKELWYSFQSRYTQLLEDKTIQAIVVDTATLLWQCCSLAFLQEKQEAQLDSGGNLKPKEDKLRERLQQMEYTEANNRMRGIYYAAKSYQKHLVLVHHSRDEYKSVPTPAGIEEMRTGKKELAGWSYVGDMADIVVQTDTKLSNNGIVPVGKITVCGLSLNAVGIELEEPSYDKIIQLLELL